MFNGMTRNEANILIELHINRFLQKTNKFDTNI